MLMRLYKAIARRTAFGALPNAHVFCALCLRFQTFAATTAAGGGCRLRKFLLLQVRLCEQDDFWWYIYISGGV